MSGEDDPRRGLPSVDRLLADERSVRLVERWGREPVKGALRSALERARERLEDGRRTESPSAETLVRSAEDALAAERPSLRGLLNGTGVVLHTNLGRAPLAEEALEAVRGVSAGYSNLELELETGERGSRYSHAVRGLRELTGAEAALVVNNNAAAVSLAVNELARGREVVVSRGELVEIGGSFRVPDVVERSGARLREVGTTNRTRLSDYAEAAGPETGMFLKVHPSNYRVSGFSSEASLERLAELGRRLDVPVVYDLGSGLLRPELLEGFPSEPSPRESLAAGADLVSWSGDKLLGGPQAGVLLGSESLVGGLRENPLLRAFRVDKMTLAALEATLALYRDPERAAGRIPALRMLREPADSVEARAVRALRELRGGREGRPGGEGERGESGEDERAVRPEVEVRKLRAVPGGGSFPGHELASAGWAVRDVDPDRLARACREGDPPLVGRIAEGEFLVDFRTVLPGQEGTVAKVVSRALSRIASEPSERGGS